MEYERRGRTSKKKAKDKMKRMQNLKNQCEDSTLQRQKGKELKWTQVKMETSQQHYQYQKPGEKF